MALRKNPKIDLKLHYKKVLEISLVLSLTLLIVAFRVFPKFEKPDVMAESPQDTITLEDVVNTKQETTPPPPPKPPIPIETVSEDILEDIPISSTELNPDETVNTQPTKPPEVKKNDYEEPPFYPFAEEQPEPVGGMEAIYNSLEYPKLAQRAGIQGNVKFFAYVDKNGDVVKTELIKGIGGGCDEEAMKKIKQIKFKPGRQGGRPVNVKLGMSITFILN